MVAPLDPLPEIRPLFDAARLTTLADVRRALRTTRRLLAEMHAARAKTEARVPTSDTSRVYQHQALEAVAIPIGIFEQTETALLARWQQLHAERTTRRTKETR